MMHIHILGICGTFMGGIAAIARQAGHRVTGCDANVYPPMSTQLESQGIELIEGFSPDQLLQFETMPDLFVIGNVVSRGNPLMEAILNQGLPYTSGPQWLGEQVLFGRHVLAVAGTHGKTTTSAMLTWILEFNGYQPGYLIGGVPLNFTVSARLGESEYFVIEADEYDTAFFDKRSKFVHYRPRTALLNNLEFDHADIFADLLAIETQFHHLVRTVPGDGLLVVNGEEPALERVIARGAWAPVERFGQAAQNEWSLVSQAHDGFSVLHLGKELAQVTWAPDSGVMGRHNQLNALAAIAAANHIGISPVDSAKALAQFKNVKRRLETIGIRNDITVYDDFAHHPTAITTTVDGLRRRVGQARILAVLEPRSNTMKLGVMKAQLPDSLSMADKVFAYGANAGKESLGWDLTEVFSPLNTVAADKAKAFDNLDALVNAVVSEAKPGDHILVMSNGGFGGVHQKILSAL
ncbi:UDP-N-acetylmuramate: L-alanyl-gamma-D-glutamyl-meso-diaminopimelate ligase [Polynucleobacter sphagniphilus]|jgi:UDP-N-acetylmuramate: L-alanyl-gamma-D-glutamyl-meso-diaminopimelate ligase|uniref:UDP-N-acetylmuramate--L-alanyl-gamma-D-glutamyl-meso-2,6-diaminoheptandioate ligase n=2 Tax=Polynucleobacter sphagniphilus TaxID=1743169 RepID=A0AA43S5K1_9BURK|nr:UDP-N-acetylmuramate: L-alanyl-gamma-D-glutamyl-meso-diaminopimelate ligase [Polynucleobacter sphagniphilus]MDH6298958.1 UDP-N-acetylmuramate: L-alanyl-gamma-D-glutamyl-meso-diaminopimelate ligase [Polynucleobacter sphagniphilus]MDH6504639.1 UDP-N-acetylmuramate: L-alanyl-gamma-D-glutamyl-meso-diaminopimelate ligase [Polynucleobacter sphagniphilus]MDH6513266.1 UDP-N-acetylmuramate: L-alanyl-gamma-D-glutamyl-meso-diaminopimelate ligase [Polynucleobacter sphagniphilus]MDH6524878.1 UDP-N-acetyl